MRGSPWEDSAPFSATVSLNPSQLSGGIDSGVSPQYDPASLAEKIASEGKRFPKAYIACGSKDFLYEDNLKFRDKLIGLGVDVTWDNIPEYGHEWRFWNIEVERFLDWIPRTDEYALCGAKRKV